MKKQAAQQLRREIFVLTPEEKRTICFVLIAFMLGLATKQYRATHYPTVSRTEVTSSISASPVPAQKRVKSDRSPRPN